jgi:hypothetical protein
MSELTAACLFGLYHFIHAMCVFLILALVYTTEPRGPITRLRSITESFLVALIATATTPFLTMPFYKGFTSTETSLLGMFHALTALTFAHYLEVFLDLRYRRPSTSLQFFFELFGIAWLASTCFAAWSMVLVIFLPSFADRL